MCATQQQIDETVVTNTCINTANVMIQAGYNTIDAISGGFLTSLHNLWTGVHMNKTGVTLTDACIEVGNTMIGLGLTVLDDACDGFITHLETVWNNGNLIPLQSVPMCPPGTPPEACPEGIPGDPG